MYSLSRAVTNAYAEIEQEQNKYKPAVTLGHKIAPNDDGQLQFKQARQAAAKIAAALPRCANMKIGRGNDKIDTASDNLKIDPITSFKIAQHQGWNGLGQFNQLQNAAANAPVATQAAPTKQVKRKLVAGKDYPVTEITDGMSPVEKRQARIANAKAKSAAYKALKESGEDMVAAPVAQAAAAPAQAAGPSRADAAAAAGIQEPTLIEITDDMDPGDVRKARIANAKAMSAYKKALKAAGIDPNEAEAAPAPAPAPVAEAVAEAPAPASSGSDAAAAAGVPKPDLVEITDDMDPGAMRQARIANAKAVSAYKKALKAAGVDPSTVDI
ncbi:MAG: hypothetical protein KDE51_26595 [Anaerolineales bacterium]|nr:hypothetical protein [Anaerolineales bacterium]